MDFTINDDIWSVFTVIEARYCFYLYILKVIFLNISIHTFDDKFTKIPSTFSSGADLDLHFLIFLK